MADIEDIPSDREEMRKLFHEAYSKWKSDKEENRLSVKNDTVYDEIIETFRKKACGRQLTTKEYNWLSRFECVWQGGKEVLQHKGKIVIKESSLFKGQKQQAEKMLETSARRFKPLEVGQNVRVPVADVDRAKTDARNILGIVIEKIDDFYKIGTKNGRLMQLFARNQLEPTSEIFMQINEVPDFEIRSIRTAAAEESVSGGQGHVHCNCKSRCQDRKCKCRRDGRLCNSRCHSSLTCTNK